MIVAWLWIPLTIFAAAAQTVRNAAQRSLVNDLGALGATLVRFVYGMPFLTLWLALMLWREDTPMPRLSPTFAIWILAGALGQMAGTALLLRAMAARSFAIGLVYSKSEALQVALFSVIFLGEALSPWGIFAMVVATGGVVMLSLRAGTLSGGSRWADPAALFGLGSGTAFAISVIGYRGAALALDTSSPFLAAAETLFWAQLLQTVLLGLWLAVRTPHVLRAVVREWKRSFFAGFAGAAASAANVTALTIEPASHVRTLILIEVLFSYAVSLRVFREAISRRELAGICLLILGVGTIVATRG